MSSYRLDTTASRNLGARASRLHPFLKEVPMRHHWMMFCLILGLVYIPVAMAGPYLNEQWHYDLFDSPNRMEFGASPGIVDLGINTVGDEPDADFEIVTGSDEIAPLVPMADADGIWRAFDSQGNIEWAVSTDTDQARSSVAIADIDLDTLPDIAGGTTSGWYVEVLDRTGVFMWAFPSPTAGYAPGNAWHSSPALADLITGQDNLDGLEVVIGCSRGSYELPTTATILPGVWMFDGDNSDGVDDGISIDPVVELGYPGTVDPEGTTWDVIWHFDCERTVSTPAIGDVDNDGVLEVVIGSDDGNLYCLDGQTGTLEWSYSTPAKITGSAGLADFDGDGDLEVIFGSHSQSIYAIDGDEDGSGSIDPSEVTEFFTGGTVESSPAIGDLDASGDLEFVIGNANGDLFGMTYDVATNSLTPLWSTNLGGAVISSPALATRTSPVTYAMDWPMFRHDAQRTGYYGASSGQSLAVYVGSGDSNLYLLDGATGSVIDTFTTHGVVSTSPAVADIDGDNYLEIVFADWGQDAGYPNDTFWCLEDRWDSALPVELAAFAGQASEQGIQLQWLTLSEKNNLGFHVYRSEREKGPYSRVSSVLIAGHGTDSTPHEYRFLDDTAMPGQTYWYIIEDLDFFGEAERSRPVRVVFDILDSITQELPAEPLLHQNFPNPFNPETWFPFELSEATDVHIRVFNLNGHLVRQLDLGRREAGRYLNQTGAAHWDGRDQSGRLVESGLYFYQIQAGDFTATRKMVVLK